jgi:hypothetical protein
MRLILHIGTEKTGSKSIQQCLFQNRKYLLSNDVAVFKSFGEINNRKLVTVCMDTNRVDDHVFTLGLNTAEQRSSWSKAVLKEFEIEYTMFSKHAKTAVISSEHFHSILRTEAELIKLKSILSTYFDDIQIFVYLRRQDLVALSRYSTALREGYKIKDVFPISMKESNLFYNYFRLLDFWSKTFGAENIKPVIFEKEKFINSDLLTDFFLRTSLLNKEILNHLQKPKQVNKSLPWQTQKVLLRYNSLFSYSENGRPKKGPRKLRGGITKIMNSIFKGEGLKPSKADAIKFYNIFKESNEKLGIQWFETSQPFSEDFSLYPERNTYN